LIFKRPTQNQILVLASIFQSCYLVDQLSQKGVVPEKEFTKSMEILFHQNPKNMQAIFGSSENLHHGIKSIQELLTSGANTKTPETLRYAIGAMHLAKKLRKNKKISTVIKKSLKDSVAQIEYFSISHANVIASTAQTYQDTFGTFFYRINIHGHIDFLKQEFIVARIRCLLFSAIRTSMLFHQIGGRRYQLIFNKKHILDELAKLASASYASQN